MGLWSGLETLGYLFYVVSPRKTSFKTMDEVPKYEILPHLMGLFVLEQLFMMLNGKRTARINDSLVSISQGMLFELAKVLMRNWSYVMYVYIYENWRLVTLPWNSLWTWWICLMATDFLFYWGHRASHEVNFLWAAHQVHHSSEDYNLITAIRQSIFQAFYQSIFNLPMALAIPPSISLVHYYFNLLFQFWVHTEAIPSLGPIGYVLNTPSHHKVHHGRNRYCINKNYAAVFIIWDRMFGTFAPESEEVVYGITHPINSFESLYIQMGYSLHLWRTFWSIEGWKNKLSVLFKGPGWSPGTPWQGRIEDIPVVKAPEKLYNPPFPLWCKMYVILHVIPATFIHLEIMEGYQLLPEAILYGTVFYLAISVFINGMLLEGRKYACWLELFRCILYTAVDYYFLPYTRLSSLSSLYQVMFVASMRLTFGASVIFWLGHFLKNVTVTLYPRSKTVD